MNEKIKQFAEQAGLETQPAKLKIYKNDDGTVTSGGWEYPLEKFAELIVKECIVDFYRRYLDICSDEDITVQVERYVKEYFGVEQ